MRSIVGVNERLNAMEPGIRLKRPPAGLNPGTRGLIRHHLTY